MHQANIVGWKYLANKYQKYFQNPSRVLEVGSYNVNGSIRDCFPIIADYTGVDWRPGPCVDIVCQAKDMQFSNKFDLVASAGTLEHDATWEDSLKKMIELLKEDGMLSLSWGAARCPAHCNETATDGKFHALPAGKVIAFLQKLGMYVHEFRYEGNLPNTNQYFSEGGMGETILVAFKNVKYAIGEPHIEELLKEDSVS